MWLIGGREATWDKYKEIYIGHSPTIREFEDGMPVNIGNVWNMDTGGTYSGRLSLMNIDTKEITQSEFLYKLYPDEMGRNGEYLAKINQP
jgi:serine/threonine protein phosphatase 1